MDQKSLEEALAGLCPEVKFVPEIDSTNRLAVEWVRSGAADGAMVAADYQTAGRGRFDRTWYAPPGECLLFSLIRRLDCEPQEAPLINLAAAAALAGAVGEEGLTARVKWPNDVLVGGRKIAGILSEAVLPGPSSPGAAAGRLPVVLGVGVNVNVHDFPPQFAESATSVALEAGRPIDRLALLKRFLERLEDLCRSFPAGVVEAYIPWSDVLGRQVRVDLPDGFVEDRAQTIDALGSLVLGSGRVISAGDVGYVRFTEL